MTLFMRIGAIQVFKRQYSFQSSMEMQLIQHDNARTHKSIRTQEGISIFGWPLLPHPSYSPDLAPSDFNRFVPLKDAQREARFEDDESVILAVRT
jgi:histone-lysine N-methyltransferase SETMAR